MFTLPFVLSLLLTGQDDINVPPLALREIMRRGAMVVETDANYREDSELASVVEAMAPPPDDSHKWFFTLVVTDGCKWCEKMKSDFDNNEKLKAWVDTKDWKNSWAHWQVVRYEDPTQAWRWQYFKPKGFPTLIVQPPINGSWGDPKTIVYLRTGYLEPSKLDAEIRRAIQSYCRKVHPEHISWKSSRANSNANTEIPKKANPPKLLITNTAWYSSSNDDSDVGQYEGPKPPFTPAPKVPPVPVTPDDKYPDQVPPYPFYREVPRTVTIPIPNLSDPLALNTIMLVILLGMHGWIAYRMLAKKLNIPLMLTDEQFNNLMKVLGMKDKDQS